MSHMMMRPSFLAMCSLSRRVFARLLWSLNVPTTPSTISYFAPKTADEPKRGVHGSNTPSHEGRISFPCHKAIGGWDTFSLLQPTRVMVKQPPPVTEQS